MVQKTIIAPKCDTFYEEIRRGKVLVGGHQIRSRFTSLIPVDFPVCANQRARTVHQVRFTEGSLHLTITCIPLTHGMKLTETE